MDSEDTEARAMIRLLDIYNSLANIMTWYLWCLIDSMKWEYHPLNRRLAAPLTPSNILSCFVVTLRLLTVISHKVGQLIGRSTYSLVGIMCVLFLLWMNVLVLIRFFHRVELEYCRHGSRTASLVCKAWPVNIFF